MCLVMQGMYEWKRDRPEEAKAWFRRAQKQCEDMLMRSPDMPVTPEFPRKYKNRMSSIFNDWAKMYEKYPDLVDLEVKARSGKTEDRLALLRLLQGLVTRYGPIDEAWFWNRHNPHALLNSLKLTLI